MRRSWPCRASPEAGAAGLLDYKTHPELDEVDKLVVEYAVAVTNGWNRTRDEMFTRLKAHFSEAQIVELTWRTALCGAFNRFNDILQLDIEPGVAVARGGRDGVIPGLVPGIQPRHLRRRKRMADPGDKHRDDNDGASHR